MSTMTIKAARRIYDKLKPCLLYCEWQRGGVRWVPETSSMYPLLTKRGAKPPTFDQFVNWHHIEVI